MPRWGLTGGIATGKSFVATLFVAQGVPVVDADRIYHALIAPTPDGPSDLARSIAATFDNVLRPDHTLDRAALGARIFGDIKARERLNGITHQVVHEHAEAACRAYESQGHKLVIYDVPLLIELGLEQRYAGVVLVYARREVQLTRLMARDQLSQGDAQKRIDSQWPIEDKRRFAAHIIDNSQSMAHTQKQVLDVLTLMRAQASR